MDPVKLIVDGAALQHMLRAPGGAVFNNMLERATRVQLRARENAPYRTGCLRESIVKRFVVGPEGVEIRVVCDTTGCSPTRTSYALWVEEGTKPHRIVARNAKALAFEVAGELRFAREVQHPGTKGVHFLKNALPLALL